VTTPSEVTNWQVRYLDIYQFYVYGYDQPSTSATGLLLSGTCLAECGRLAYGLCTDCLTDLLAEDRQAIEIRQQLVLMYTDRHLSTTHMAQ